MKERKYGWKPDLPDHNDICYRVAAPIVLPSKVDLRGGMPPVYDQGQLGSCTSNAIAAAHQYEQIKQGLHSFNPSRLFIYYNERAIEGTVTQDSGAMIRDGLKTVNTQGVCDEKILPYNIEKFTHKPSATCYKKALSNIVTQYQRLDNTNLEMLKQCLAAGNPFVFGFTVYPYFESQQMVNTGVLRLPTKGEKALGGHAVCAVGYDDDLGVVIVRNSWGSSWGMHGYFTMPYKYITNPNLCDDFWTIQMVK